ncbi:MAG TPA: NAD(P)-dependent oxidoreductase [Gemmatimonadales bacterium]|jgi:3-hydroxyisobutyrate dehydrogenase-like beta-hydroxyacid dehydrogenase|nr:NAD(P)-dependent oxidoreductase [Gemmatimonadales bacterium]
MTGPVAFLGLGAMGTPMAANLLAAGFALRVWNRTAAKAKALTGAEWAASPREAAEGAAVVITMLADDAAVEATTFGPHGLLAGLGPDGVHAGMSTVSVACTRRLVVAHAERGSAYVAAPVFGRPEAARARQLWIVAGGASDRLARLEPVFDALGRGVFTLGTAAEAALLKLVGNFLIGAMVESLGEALVLAERGGLDPERVVEILGESLFPSPVFRSYGARIARAEFEPAGFALPLALKDFNLIRAAAEEAGVPLPVAELVRGRLEESRRRGRDRFDFAGLAALVREAAGLPPVRS